MPNITAGVQLTLRDQFSSGIQKAGIEVQKFGRSGALVMDKLDRATSGIGAKMAGFGLTLGAGAAVSQVIEYTDRVNRLGTSMNLSVADTDKLKRAIVSVAGDHNIKLNPEGLTSAVEQIGELTGDAKFAQENLRTLGLVMQATGASGEAIGGMAAELQKMKLASAEVAEAMGTLTAQGQAGAFTIKNFAEMGPRLYSAYAAAGRTGVKASAELGAVMQVIRQGTGTSEQAGTAFEAMMRNLTDPVKQQMLKQMGVAVRDQAGNFRSVTELIPEIVTKGKSLEKLGTIFDSEAIRAFNASLAEFQATGAVKGIERFSSVVGGLSDLEAMSARNASSFKSNITGLQTAFGKFADANLSQPLGALTDVLNTLATKPLEVKKAFTMMAVAIGAVAAVKGFSAVKGLVNDFKGLKGGKLEVGGSLSKTGVGATPVMVTNWPAGGVGATGGMPEGAVTGDDAPGGAGASGGAGKASPKSRFAQGAKSAVKTAGVLSLVTAGVGVVAALSDKESSNNEKAKAVGNSVGAAAGGVVGAAIGAGLGSIVPGIGTAIGGVVGGMLGSWLGGMGGEAVGNLAETELSGRNRASATQLAGHSLGPSGSQLGKSQLPGTAGPSGTIKQTIDLNLTGDKPTASVRTSSDMPGFVPDTGSSRVARGY